MTQENKIQDEPIYGTIQAETCPESPTGKPHDAVLIDLVRLGPLVTFNQEGKSKTDFWVEYVFQVFPQDGSRQSNGQPFYFRKEATTSLFAGNGDFGPSVSYQVVMGMRGRDFGPGEAQKYDFRQLIGKPCRLNIFHKNGFPQLSKDTTPGFRGVEPYNDENGRFILDQKLWPKAEPEYYFPEDPQILIAKLTNPERFKKASERTATTEPQATTMTGSKTDDDGIIPF